MRMKGATIVLWGPELIPIFYENELIENGTAFTLGLQSLNIERIES